MKETFHMKLTKSILCLILTLNSLVFAEEIFHSPRLLIKIPTRSRPIQFFKYLDAYYKKLSYKFPYHFLITCDNDDLTMNNPEVIERLKEYPNLSFRFGNSKTKIEAYNKNINEFIDSFDILILSSDDMEPKIDNFDEIIVQEMLRYFPDFDGVLNFSGGRDPEELRINVYPIMGKNWYKRFGYVYYPGYKSEFCDNELSEVSAFLGKEKIFQEILFRHKYPIHKLDKLYIRNNEMACEDAQLFQERKEQNFFLKKE